MNLTQLRLTGQQLENIGFVKSVFKDQAEQDRIIYKIETINGYFYYNPNEDIYKWYISTIIGSGANDIHLDITNIEELFTILTCFRTPFHYLAGV